MNPIILSSQPRISTKGWRTIRLNGRVVRVCRLEAAEHNHGDTGILNTLRHWAAISRCIDAENQFQVV
jgi:hypothetical protein